MSKQVKIIIIDDDKEYVENLRNELKKVKEFDILGIAYNGEEGYHMITAFNPDVVLLDVLMPGLDGIGVLEKINSIKMEKFPNVIMISEVSNKEIIKNAIGLGAKYYLVKPVDYSILIRRINSITKRLKEDTPNKFLIREDNTRYIIDDEIIIRDRDLEISNILHTLGIPVHLKGYQYLKTAISLVTDDITYLEQVTKGLYPKIADEYGIEPSKIERSIRSVLEIAWSRINSRYASNVLGYNVMPTKRPSNAEFIAMIADKVRLREKAYQIEREMINK